MPSEFCLPVIGAVKSPFREKFGLPRQPGLVDFDCHIELLPPYNQPDAFEGLEGFSHIWVSFIFHQALKEGFQPTVRPPRLGGNRRRGVFATRSPFRPGGLGLSLVELKAIESGPAGSGLRLWVAGLDAIDGTPVVDIKPYLPYVESVPQARGGFAPAAPASRLQVRVAGQAESQMQKMPEELQALAMQVIALDPRPAYRQPETSGEYGIRLGDFNVRWRIEGEFAEIFSVDSSL